tara:strand:- start:869 stop:1138 length:270 start_codon:yes stop_codon:yes gene_type:complete
METTVFSIYDVKAGTFSRPFIAVREGEASRTFVDLINAPQKDNPFAQHPEDYSLHRVGKWNMGSGELIDVVNYTIITGLQARAEDNEKE